MTTQTETAFGAALGRAGLNTAEYRLRMIVTDALRKHHGNRERAIKTVDSAIYGDAELVRECIAAFVRSFEFTGADQVVVAAQNCTVQPQNGDGAGQGSNAAQGAFARPAREPSAQERAAAAGVAQRISVLDTFRVRDGRAIGDIRYGELESLRNSNAMEAALIRQIQKHAAASHDMRVRDIVKAEDLQRMIQRAAEFADVA